MPRGMPMSLSTATEPSWYSDMSIADHLLLVAEQELGDRLRELGLADAGRAEEQQDAVRPIEAVLERPLVQHQPARHRADGLLLADDPLLQTLPRCP